MEFFLEESQQLLAEDSAVRDVTPRHTVGLSQTFSNKLGKLSKKQKARKQCVEKLQK